MFSAVSSYFLHIRHMGPSLQSSIFRMCFLNGPCPVDIRKHSTFLISFLSTSNMYRLSEACIWVFVDQVIPAPGVLLFGPLKNNRPDYSIPHTGFVPSIESGLNAGWLYVYEYMHTWVASLNTQLKSTQDHKQFCMKDHELVIHRASVSGSSLEIPAPAWLLTIEQFVQKTSWSFVCWDFSLNSFLTPIMIVNRCVHKIMVNIIWFWIYIRAH